MPTPLWAVRAGSRSRTHPAFGRQAPCVVGYDNETGKGDHKHFGKRELHYRFVDVETLVADFYTDVRSYK
jgi:hypothetical protein